MASPAEPGTPRTRASLFDFDVMDEAEEAIERGEDVATEVLLRGVTLAEAAAIAEAEDRSADSDEEADVLNDENGTSSVVQPAWESIDWTEASESTYEVVFSPYVGIRCSPSVNSQKRGVVPLGHRVRGAEFMLGVGEGLPWLRLAPDFAGPYLADAAREHDGEQHWGEAVHCVQCGQAVASTAEFVETSRHAKGQLRPLGHFSSALAGGARAMGQSELLGEADAPFQGWWRRAVQCCKCMGRLGWYFDRTGSSFWGFHWEALREGHPRGSYWLLMDSTRYGFGKQLRHDPHYVWKAEDLDRLWEHCWSVMTCQPEAHGPQSGQCAAAKPDATDLGHREPPHVVGEPKVQDDAFHGGRASAEPSPPEDDSADGRAGERAAAAEGYAVRLLEPVPQRAVGAVRACYATQAWQLDGSDGRELKPPSVLEAGDGLRIQSPVADLRACGCPANTVRPRFMNFCLEFIDLHLTRERPLVYVTLGSGKLYHDWEVIEELLSCGYKIAEVHAVDGNYKSSIEEANDWSPGTANALRAFAAWLWTVEEVPLAAHSSLDAFVAAKGGTADVLMQCDAVCQSAHLAAAMRPGGLHLYMTQASGRLLEARTKPNSAGEPQQGGVGTGRHFEGPRVEGMHADPLHAELEGLLLLRRRAGAAGRPRMGGCRPPATARQRRFWARCRERALREGALYRVVGERFPYDWNRGCIGACTEPSKKSKVVAHYMVNDEVVLDLKTRIEDGPQKSWVKLRMEQLEGSVGSVPGWVFLGHKDSQYLEPVAELTTRRRVLDHRN